VRRDLSVQYGGLLSKTVMCEPCKVYKLYKANLLLREGFEENQQGNAGDFTVS